MREQQATSFLASNSHHEVIQELECLKAIDYDTIELVAASPKSETY